MIRGGFRAAATYKMECFVIIVNSWNPLTIIKKHSILDVAAALDPPLMMVDNNNWFHGRVNRRKGANSILYELFYFVSVSGERKEVGTRNLRFGEKSCERHLDPKNIYPGDSTRRT